MTFRVLSSLCFFTALLLSLPLAGTSEASCVDYGDYMHWTASVPIEGTGYDMEITGDLAYVADLGFGLKVLDISNPEQPQVIGEAVGTENARELCK